MNCIYKFQNILLKQKGIYKMVHDKIDKVLLKITLQPRHKNLEYSIHF